MASLKLISGLILAIFLLLTPALAIEFSKSAIDSGEALAELGKQALKNSNKLSKRGFGGTCTPSNIRIRKEWRTLSKQERKNFIAAVQCLQAKPSVFGGSIPGSISLFDDFVAVHLFQTPTIHFTATFLTWHRYYIWTYEQKLRTVCGYQGALPYWEWGLDVNNPAASPLFDGSSTSLGSDGAYVPHPGYVLAQPFDTTLIPLPPGTGGGCVHSGPFSNMTLHLGPVALPTYGANNFTGVADPLADNPRCLKRDLNGYVTKRWSSFYNTTTLILLYNNVELFQAHMQGDTRYLLGEMGVHGGGHYTLGGDPGGDPFISPGDPAFYLHHAQIDRVYWIWQLLDFPHRQNVWGTGTLQDVPPSPNITVNDSIDLSPLGSPVQIKDLMNTVGGAPLCYVYL